MAKVYVLFSVHTEDCINPVTDDVPLRLADVANQHGCQLVPKVTTDKLRALRRNGRDDVVAALKTQDVGFHMTNHSFPPTVPVYTQAMGWDEGVREYERVERAGYAEWCDTFGGPAPTYAQGTATPFAFPVLRRWGIATYTCSSCVSLDGRPHHYQGLLKQDWGPPNGFHLGYRITDDGLAPQLAAEFDAVYEPLQRTGGGLVSISSHECEWAAHEFWDENFRQGRLVLPADFRAARLKTPAETERGYANLAALIEHIQAQPDTEIISSRRLHELYRDRLAGEDLEIGEVVALARAATDEITWQPLRGQHVSAAETFGLVVTALSDWFASGRLPETVPLRFLGGPPRPSVTARPVAPLDAAVLAHVLADVRDYLDWWERVPAEAWRGNQAIAPADLLATLAHALVALAEHGALPASLPIATGRVTCWRHAPEAAGVSTWPSFPEDFADHHGVAMARLQCWTLKPATLG